MEVAYIVTLKSGVLREVGALARCIQSISDIKYRELNLQRGQFIFLTRICENQGISLIELSNLLKVDKATTTKAVQKLMLEHYVLKKRNAEDKRGWHLFPTDKAQAIYQYIIEEENHHITTCFAGLSQEEQAIVCRLLQKMSENMEHDWKELKNHKSDLSSEEIS